jgi:peptidyl-prolyl cis-trans isomerase SurA
MKYCKFSLLIIFLILSTTRAQQVIDKIVAVIDNEIILKSEIDLQAGLYAAEKKLDPNTPGLREEVLEAMIQEKLAFAQANLDSIIVSDEEVDSRLEYQIEVFKQRYGSEARIEEIYGMSIQRIKKELRDDVYKQLMTQRFKQQKFGFIEAGRREVEEFFYTYRDSLGIIPEKVKIYHIFRNPKATEEIKKKFYNATTTILDSIKTGADFAEMAKKYSEDPGSAVHGGDLGFVQRGVFYPEFESAAFALEVGEISGIVESPVGYHIIQLLEKRGDAIKTRHILIKIKGDEEADLNTIEFLSDIRDSIVRGFGTFSYYAKKYSEDNESKPFGGELGSFYLNQLDKNLLDIVSKLKEGEISFPRRIEYGPDIYGYHIVYLEKRIPQHQASLETDYAELKRLADEVKRQKHYEEWIEEIKSKIFWEVRL